MLVHKQTKGVLEYAPWDGTYTKNRFGARLPVLRRATLAGLGLSPDEWWEVPDHTDLARRVRLCYPCFDAVVDERGALLNVNIWPAWAVYGEEPPPTGQLPKKRRRRRIGIRL